MSRIFSGGRPMTALFPLMTIGLSISIGFSIMILMIASSDTSLPLKFFTQMSSFCRTSSIGAMPNSLMMVCNSSKEGTSVRYFTTSNAFPDFSTSSSPSLDFPQRGLWYILIMIFSIRSLVSCKEMKCKLKIGQYVVTIE